MNATDVAERRFRGVIETTTDDDLAHLWAIRDTLGEPPNSEILAGLLLAEMADRGMPAPAEPEPPADRDAQIVAAVIAGEPAKDVAARHGLSAGHVRRLTATARGSRTPALRVVSDEPPPEPDDLTAAERALGQSWRDALPDDRIAVKDGDTIPRPAPPDLFGLFYSGLSNLLAGAPDTGKSYFVLEAVRDAHIAGRVLWLDAEDTAETFSRRCLQLGCPELTTSPDVRRVDHSDWTAAEPEHIEDCFAWLAEGFGPGLIVIDSGTASGAGDSLDQWNAWKQWHLPPQGVGSILIEHVVKDPEARHNQAGGSRGKGAHVRGMALLIDEHDGTGWAPGTDTTPPQPGGYGFICSKNKPGGHGWKKRQRIGTLHGTPHNDGTLTLAVQVGTQARSLKDDVANHVAKHPGNTTTEISNMLTGDKKARSAAIIQAETAGLIIRADGPNGSKLCYPPDTPTSTP